MSHIQGKNYYEREDETNDRFTLSHFTGIDDGAQTETDSLAMAQQALSEGIHTIVATPHHQNGKYINERTSIIHGVKQLNDELQQHNIPLTILRGKRSDYMVIY